MASIAVIRNARFRLATASRFPRSVAYNMYCYYYYGILDTDGECLRLGRQQLPASSVEMSLLAH